MILCKLKLDEESELDFALETAGTTKQPSDVRLIIKESDFDVVLHGDLKGDDVRFKVPKMKGILTSGVKETVLEVLIDGRLFKALEGSIEYEPLVETVVTKTEAKPVTESVKVKPKSVSTKTNDGDKIQEVLDEGYELEDYAGLKVMKKERRYYGVVSKNQVVRSEFPYSSPEELITALKNEKNS